MKRVSIAVLAVVLLGMAACGESPQGGSANTDQGAGGLYGDYVVMAKWTSPDLGDQSGHKEAAKEGALKRADGFDLRIVLTEESVAFTTPHLMEDENLLFGYVAQGVPTAEKSKLIMHIMAPMEMQGPEMIRLEATKEEDGRLRLALIPRSVSERHELYILRKVGDPRIREEDAALLAKTPTEAKVEAVETQMANIGLAIDTYRMANKKLPGSLQELTEADAGSPHPYIDKIRVDPWGNEYVYRILSRTSYEIRSYGEDMLPDTGDDVVLAGSR